jgi:hypothetical protein
MRKHEERNLRWAQSYIEDGLTLKEIALEAGMSAPRVRQCIEQALREIFSPYKDPITGLINLKGLGSFDGYRLKNLRGRRDLAYIFKNIQEGFTSPCTFEYGHISGYYRTERGWLQELNKRGRFGWRLLEQRRQDVPQRIQCELSRHKSTLKRYPIYEWEAWFIRQNGNNRGTQN